MAKKSATEEAKAKAERVRKHIAGWQRKIEHVIKHDEEFIDQWKRDRETAAALENSEIRVNLIGAIMEILMAFTFAKNPDINVNPTDSVNRARIEDFRELAKTIQIMVSRVLKDARLKYFAKRWVRGGMTVGLAWLKVHMQTSTENDPIMEERINDLREQVENIKSKQTIIEAQDRDPDQYIEQIESNITAAEAQLERTIAEGLVIGYIMSEQVIVATECGEVENYLASPWIALESYKSEEETLAIATNWPEEKRKEYLEKAARYAKLPAKTDETERGTGYVRMTDDMIDDDDADFPMGYYRVMEIWCKQEGVVYTMVWGCTEAWARSPYAPLTGERFYPVFQLAWHYTDNLRYPQSDVWNLSDLQQEYLDIRLDARKHRKRCKPGMIVDKTKINVESVNSLNDAETGEYVPVEMMSPEIPLRDALEQKKYPPFDAALYDTTQIQHEMEKIGGVQEALQQAVAVEKTATEARIQQAGFMGRTDTRRDVLEERLSELAEYVMQLVLQTMDAADAEKYAGPDAKWIQLSTEEALTHFSLEIKAGSTGKPQAASDRESWATLLPLISELVQKVGAARLSGQEWAAKPWIALLMETLERLDDHADIELFLPVPDEKAIAAANKDQESDKERSETELNLARKFQALADAAQDVPELALLPEFQALVGAIPPELKNGAGAETIEALPPAPEIQ